MFASQAKIAKVTQFAGAVEALALACYCWRWESQLLLRGAIRKYTFQAKIQKTVGSAFHPEHSSLRTKYSWARGRPGLRAGERRSTRCGGRRSWSTAAYAPLPHRTCMIAHKHCGAVRGKEDTPWVCIQQDGAWCVLCVFVCVMTSQVFSVSSTPSQGCIIPGDLGQPQAESPVLALLPLCL